jgi:hypothetical protein
MTFLDSTPTQSNTNHRTPETLADRHREAYQHQHRAPSLWAKLRPWAVGAVLGLLIGGAAAFAVSYQTMPVQAQHIERVFVDIEGRRAFIVSADVVFDSTPLPPTPAAGQP